MENNDGSYPRISAALVDTDEGARKMARAFETVGCFVIEGRSPSRRVCRRGVVSKHFLLKSKPLTTIQ